MTSILSRLLTSDKPWSCPYSTQQAARSVSVLSGYPVPSLVASKSYDLQTNSKKVKTTIRVPDSSVRFGRVPKREKAKILAAMQKVNASSQEKALGVELEDEFRLLSTIVRAHEETCDYTKDKVQILIEKAREHPVYAQCPPQLSCPLNSAPHITDDGASHYMEDFSERFTPAIQGVVEYAKRIPGFSFLSQDDQLTLLKAGVFEVLLVRLACMFDSQANTLISLNGQVLRRESLHSASNARFLLDSMFDFAERLNSLRLTDSEVGLFSAVVVIAADRPGLRNTDLVLKIQKKLMDILQKSVMTSHPENPNIFADLMKKIPDLRTLNTLHSEKLLAYKMEPRNQTGNGPATEMPNGGPNGSHTMLSPNIYTTIPHEIWSQYSLVATQQCLAIEEDPRSTSPGQHSQHSGTSTASEWSTTDSKDEHDLMGSPRSVGSGLCVDDAKSPMRTSSFSSSRSYVVEDVWPAEMAPQTGDFIRTKRLRDSNGSEHGSSSGDEGYFVDSPVKGTVAYPKLRRVDSPTDSGIESGKEHNGPSTTPTISVCSSPRSTVEEKVKDVMLEHEKNDHVEDMPVLKRALQAPPLVNTNMLMDEAYRHHKKFRAARRDADSPSSPSSLSLASTHSTLVRTLEQAPRYLSEQQLKRTDLIHNIIMRTETLPGQQQVNSHPHSHHQNQQSSHHLHPELSPQQQQQPNGGTSNGIHLTINSQYPFSTSVPNPSPVPPNFITSPQQQQQQQKNLLLCPSGYYIPHGNSSSPIYSTPAATWQFGQSPHTTTTISTTSVSPSPIHIHTQFVSSANSEREHSHASQSNSQNNTGNTCPVNHHSLDQQQQRSPANSAQSLSPRLIYSSRASPAAPNSPLVMNNGLPPTSAAPSPVPSVCQLESGRMPSPVQKQQQQHQGESVDSQPLNLSKKLFSPPLLKMES